MFFFQILKLCTSWKQSSQKNLIFLILKKYEKDNNGFFFGLNFQNIIVEMYSIARFQYIFGQIFLN